MISFEDFKKLDLRVAKITAAERVEGSEKLLKIQVRLAEDTRQLVAGIGKVYAPEAHIGREIVMVANLEPRQLLGFESQGMLLAADSPDGSVILVPEKEVLPGTMIK